MPVNHLLQVKVNSDMNSVSKIDCQRSHVKFMNHIAAIFFRMSGLKYLRHARMLSQKVFHHPTDKCRKGSMLLLLSPFSDQSPDETEAALART